MRNIKIVLSFALLIVIMLQIALLANANENDSTDNLNGTTLTQAETTKKSTDDYVIKFSSSSQNKLLTCDEMSTLLGQPIANGGNYEKENTTSGAKVTYNDDCSVTLSKPSTLYGVNLEVPITDEIKKRIFKKHISHP